MLQSMGLQCRTCLRDCTELNPLRTVTLLVLKHVNYPGGHNTIHSIYPLSLGWNINSAVT